MEGKIYFAIVQDRIIQSVGETYDETLDYFKCTCTNDRSFNAEMISESVYRNAIGGKCDVNQLVHTFGNVYHTEKEMEDSFSLADVANKGYRLCSPETFVNIIDACIVAKQNGMSDAKMSYAMAFELAKSIAACYGNDASSITKASVNAYKKAFINGIVIPFLKASDVWKVEKLVNARDKIVDGYIDIHTALKEMEISK